MPARCAKPTGTLRSLRAAGERKVNILFASPHGSMKGSTMVAPTDMLPGMTADQCSREGGRVSAELQVTADEPAARGDVVAETSTAAVCFRVKLLTFPRRTTDERYCS